MFTFIYIIILQKEHFSFVLDILGLNLKLQLSKYVILGVHHYHFYCPIITINYYTEAKYTFPVFVMSK